MNKVIFLDIDGVLNSNSWNNSHQKEISDGNLIDEEKIRLLGILIRNTEAKIILHSGWKFWFDFELKPLRKEADRLKKLFEKEGLCVEGITPDYSTEEIRKTKKFSLVKAKEILAWLSEHQDIDKWIVLDDLDLHNKEVAKHQIKTNPEIGLTIENIHEAEKRLMECDVIQHYDRLLDENNDPARDSKPMQEYMDKWDGTSFIFALNLKREDVVLEIGIGTGRLARKVAAECKQLYGIDISPKTIEWAQENLHEYDNITYICSDFMSYIFDEKFNVIYSSLTMMHIKEKKDFYKKVYEILKENGRFILSIDKNQTSWLDMYEYQVKLYPDTFQQTMEDISLAGLSIDEHFETEFAYVFVCRK